MNQIYMNPAEQYGASPMSYASVPELIACNYDEDTDPSPSPPVRYPNLDGYQYNSYPISAPTSHCTEFVTPQPTIINSIEFTDLTQIQREERLRGQRRSTSAQDKEAASNMRIRRRAQNRASQRAFRERKEKHVQHLERQLEDLETKHRELSQSYTDLDSTHQELQREASALRQQLDSARGSQSATASRSNSIQGSHDGDGEWNMPGSPNREAVKQESDREADAYYDPFCGSGEEFFGTQGNRAGTNQEWGF